MEAAADVFRAEGLTAEVETLAGGDPAAALVEFAKHLPAAMLAMSTHARTRLGPHRARQRGHEGRARLAVPGARPAAGPRLIVRP